MPELPEVETMRRGIQSVCDSRIADVVRLPCRLRPILIHPRLDAFRRRVLGRRVGAVGRVGKRVVLELESSDRIIFEPRMTGLVLLNNPPNEDHLRLRFDISGKGPRHLFYWDRRGLGSVRLLSPAEYETQLGSGRLGPDAMLIGLEAFRESFRNSRRPLKVALLDQHAVAGIGNLYASEILHVAGVHPARRCDRLRWIDWERVYAAMREVLEEAIRYEGSTLGDGTYRNALNNPGSYQHHHRVYDRADQLCPTCRSAVVQRIVQAQRATFFCPFCQPRNPRRGRASAASAAARPKRSSTTR